LPRSQVKSIEHVKDAEVEITFDPPWRQNERGGKIRMGLISHSQKSQSRMEDLVAFEVSITKLTFVNHN
jgi:hypothetical protein